MKFETNNLNAEFYLASLALGVLEAMKQGVVHPDIGIWSLGRLQCSQQFESSLVLSDNIKYQNQFLQANKKGLNRVMQSVKPC